MKNIFWSFLVIFFAVKEDVIFSADSFDCKCYEDAFGLESPEGCYDNNSLANTTYTMTTANCTMEITPEQSELPYLTGFALSVDIGLECDPSGFPLQYCESTICLAIDGSNEAGFPISSVVQVNGIVPLIGILKLTTNGNTVEPNHEYQVNISCETMGSTPMLEKVFSVTFIDVSTTIFISTKSTSEMVTTDRTTLLSIISTTPVKPTATTTFTHMDQTTLSTSFFDDPVNVAIISVVAGLAILGIAAIGCSVLALQFCKPMPVVIRPSNDDYEEDNK